MSKKTCFSILAALGMLLGASFAQACTLGAWTGGNAGDAAAADSTNPTSAYSGECLMTTSGGFVQDDSPGGEAEMISRFYFNASGSGSAVIYETFSDEPATNADGSSIYTVTFDASANTITVADTFGGGSATGALALNAGGEWNSVEVHWVSGGAIDVWVNADATTDAATDSATSGGGSISSSRLGAGTSGIVAKGVGFTANFDDFEARRTTNVGRLKLGDADGDGSRELSDAVLLLNEFLSPVSQIIDGQRDANEDGTFGLSDAVATLNLFLQFGA